MSDILELTYQEAVFARCFKCRSETTLYRSPDNGCYRLVCKSPQCNHEMLVAILDAGEVVRNEVPAN